MNAVVLNQLSKTYLDGKRAVDGVSLCLEPGEVYGFLGPNGAGKTTTIKMLSGMLTPSSGSCEVFGLNPAQDPEKVHAISGVVTEHAQMYDHLTGLENLVFYGSVFGRSRADSEKRGKELLAQLELSDAQDKKLATYSTGMRQRLSLARALIHEPKILWLDEPTSGLDPKSAQNVHVMIRRLAAEKEITVFLCTHQLRYAQEVCTRYGLLSQGKLLADGSLDELRRQLGTGMKVQIRAGGYEAGQKIRKVEKDIFEVRVQSETEIPGYVRQIVEAGGDIYSVQPQLPSLEDIYFSLTGKQEGKSDEK